MKNPEKYLHSWELSEKSLLIRFYMFWYAIGEPDRDSITFCKLFWAVVCAPLMGVAWIVILIIAAFVWPVIAIKEHWQSREKPAKPEKQDTPSQTAKRGAGLIPRFFSWLADKIGAFFQRHPAIGKYGRWLVILGAVVGVLGGVSYGGVRLVALIHGNWSTPVLYTVLTWIGSIVGIAIVATLLGLMLAKTGAGAYIGDRVWAFLCAIGRFFRGVGRFFATGFYAVKYRTCPVVKIS